MSYTKAWGPCNRLSDESVGPALWTAILFGLTNPDVADDPMYNRPWGTRDNSARCGSAYVAARGVDGGLVRSADKDQCLARCQKDKKHDQSTGSKPLAAQPSSAHLQIFAAKQPPMLHEQQAIRSKVVEFAGTMLTAEAALSKAPLVLAGLQELSRVPTILSDGRFKNLVMANSLTPAVMAQGTPQPGHQTGSSTGVVPAAPGKTRTEDQQGTLQSMESGHPDQESRKLSESHAAQVLLKMQTATAQVQKGRAKPHRPAIRTEAQKDEQLKHRESEDDPETYSSHEEDTDN
ncbi:hypothetical protein WJX77_002296 [Trebouxia sp. C0004]